MLFRLMGWSAVFSFFIKKKKSIYLLAVLDLSRCAGFSLAVYSGGYPVFLCVGALTVVAHLVGEHRL